MQNFTNRLSYFDRAVLGALSALRENIPDDLRNLLSFTPPILFIPVLHKFGWIADPKNPKEFNLPKLVLFHYLLQQHEFIACTYEELEIHFIHEKFPDGKIVWTGDLMVLVLLFDVLMNDSVDNKKHKKENEKQNKKVLPDNNLYDLLCEHFNLLDKKNMIKPLSRGSLTVSLHHAKADTGVKGTVKNLTDLLLA